MIIMVITVFEEEKIEDILIISDDLDMPIGKLKLRPTGSSGGHNGLKNIELMLGTNNYKRIKIGINNNSRPFNFFRLYHKRHCLAIP